MRISTNTTAMRANREIENVSREKTTTLSRISSGERIMRAEDDPAGLAISERMRAKSRGKDQAQRNANDAISFIQVAEGSLGTMQDMATRLKELALQAATDTLGDTERQFVDREFQQLKQEIKRVGENTQFSGRNLLSKDSRYDMQIDIGGKADGRMAYDLGQVFESIENIGLHTLDVKDNVRAHTSLSKLDSAMAKISEGRSKLGSLQNRMDSVISNLQVSNENILASKSRIRDADVALEASKKVGLDIRSDVAASFMVHSFEADKMALKLLS